MKSILGFDAVIPYKVLPALRCSTENGDNYDIALVENCLIVSRLSFGIAEWLRMCSTSAMVRALVTISILPVSASDRA